jgi:prophage DNA circulation protein
MAKTNVLTGSRIAAFKGIELHTYLQVITDSRGPRVVVHEFPNRDGAKTETLGRKPHRTSWQLTFTGTGWIDTLLELVRSIDDDPNGLLVHPIYGQMQVTCGGFDRSVVNIPDATDTVTIEVSFTEDQTDLGLVEQQGLAAKQQGVSSAVADFQDAASQWSDTGTVSAVESLASAATTYADVAFTAATTLVVDPSLGPRLDAVGAALATAEQALLGDSHGLGSMQTYDALAMAEVVYAACLDLADEVALETTGFQQFTVQGPTSIAVLAAQVYGQGALSKIDQILTLNDLPDPTNIPAGTVLTLPA